jgi:hypothetical protein
MAARYQITGRDELSGDPVEPFVVEADNEQDARNRAAELGVKIESVQLAPEPAGPGAGRPAPWTPPPSPGARGPRPGRLLVGILIGVLVAVLAFRYVGGRPSPAEQLKEISDAKKEQLTHFLQSKGSSLAGYEATMSEETNLDRRVDFPYVGRIKFSYAVTRPEGRSQLLNEAGARYQYSRKEAKWVYKGYFLNAGGDPAEAKDVLVRFAEVKEAFEQ